MVGWTRSAFLSLALTRLSPGCVGKDKDILEREITVIQELLEVEENSKCMCGFFTTRTAPLTWDLAIGCLESLVHYKSLLLALPESSASKEKLLEECRSSLAVLEQIDPKRRTRYRDLGQSGSPSY